MTTVLERRIAPEYSSFYVAGSTTVEVPVGGDPRTVRASRACINISCLNVQDGDTTVLLGHAQDLKASGRLIYDGVLETRSGEVIVFDANDPEILSIAVSSAEIRVRVWANRLSEPDRVEIGLDSL